MSLTGWMKSAVLRLARVPAEPHVPEGDPESVRVFHPGRNYFLWRLVLWGAGNAVVAIVPAALFAVSFFSKLSPLARGIVGVVAVGAACVFVVSIPVTYFLQRLNYEMRWYIVNDRSLRIRSGVVWLQEMTMTFANIQEIRVNSNPLERLLGLANVEVRSAGGGEVGPHGQVSSGHVGTFAGVDNAEAIRDFLMERLRVYRSSGLGERAEVREPAGLVAAKEVLAEARALRGAVEGGVR